MNNEQQKCHECGKPVGNNDHPNAKVSHMACAMKACAEQRKEQMDWRAAKQKEMEDFRNKWPKWMDF
jgi:hypothetical protein